MDARQRTLVAAVLVTGLAALAVPAVAAGAPTAMADGDLSALQNDSEPAANASGASLGAQLSAFMQTTAAETNGSVDAGMWEARYERSNRSARERVVRNRFGQLERRLERLQGRLAAIEAARADDELPRVAYLAQASHVTARIESLQRSINETETRAAAAGVNASRLDRLKRGVRNATGSAVSAVARSLPVVRPPPARGHGPPAHAGPPTRDVGNETRGGPPAEPGPPGDRPGGPAADTTGPPDRQGSGHGAETGTGEADESKPGEGAGTGGPGDNGADSTGPSGQPGNGPRDGGSDSGNGDPGT